MCGYRRTAELIALPDQHPPYSAVYTILHHTGELVDRQPDETK
jgi:hypothetical protein